VIGRRANSHVMRKVVTDTCQRNKAGVHQNVGLAPNDVPEGLWQVVGQDLIMGLPNVKGFHAIATFVDHYEKQVHVVPTTDTVDSDGIAEIHHCDIFRLHGIPGSSSQTGVRNLHLA
jgi:hypothetical protein